MLKNNFRQFGRFGYLMIALMLSPLVITLAYSAANQPPLKPTIKYLGPAADFAFRLLLEAETMSIKTTGQADPAVNPTTWLMTESGDIAENVNFPETKEYNFILTAKGTEIEGEWPTVEVRIDQQTKATVTVNSAVYKRLIMRFEVPAGMHEVALAYVNGSTQPPGTRQLSLDSLHISDLPYVPGQMLVRFKRAGQNALLSCPDKIFATEGSFRAKTADNSSSLDELLAKYPVYSAKPISGVCENPSPMAAQEEEDPIDVKGIFKYEVALTTNIDKMVTDYQADQHVVYAETDNFHKINKTVNDPRFSELWALFKIEAPQAWDISNGEGNNVIAVVNDTGVDYTHEDLKDHMWRNSGEIPDNGIDDDNNGYVDDVYGYDFVYGDSNPMDGNRHGTHVAGTIGAVSNNGIGVAGVAPQVRIMATKGLEDDGSGPTSALGEGIIYATAVSQKEKRRMVINNSWGGGDRSITLENIVSNAVSQGVVVVFAAGNDYGLPPTSPNNMGEVICVGATDRNDRAASFSNRGSALDVSAPGVSILSTVPGGYFVLQGTSMAAPHVAGLAALILGKNPSLTPKEVETIIRNTADNVIGDPLMGTGRINAFKALGGSTLPDTDPPIISNIRAESITSNSAVISWTTNEIADSQVDYDTTSNTFRNSTPVQDISTKVTSHRVTLTGLSPETKYYFRVRSKDAAPTPNAAVSGEQSFTTLPTGGGNITLSVSSTNISVKGDVSVSWTAPAGSTMANDWIAMYPANVTDNTQYIRPFYNTHRTNGTLTGSIKFSSPHTDNTGDYVFRYLVNDSFTHVAQSAVVHIGPVANPPVISSVQFSNVTAAGATITWSTDRPADSQVEYGTTTAYGNLTLLDPVLGLSHSVALSGLNAQTTYHFRVKSKDAAGLSAQSGDFSFTTLAGGNDTTPPTISVFKIQADGKEALPGGQLEVKTAGQKPKAIWSTADAGSGIKEVKLKRANFVAGKCDMDIRTDVDCGWMYLVTNGAAVNPTGFTDSLAAEKADYLYSLEAWDNAGNCALENGDPCGDNNGGDKIPLAPTNLTAIAISSTQINLSWTDNSINESGFKIERGPGSSPSSWSEIATVGVDVKSYSNTGLTASTTYSYRVRAYNTAGNSNYSNTASATTTTSNNPCKKDLCIEKGPIWTTLAYPGEGTFSFVVTNNTNKDTGYLKVELRVKRHMSLVDWKVVDQKTFENIPANGGSVSGSFTWAPNEAVTPYDKRYNYFVEAKIYETDLKAGEVDPIQFSGTKYDNLQVFQYPQNSWPSLVHLNDVKTSGISFTFRTINMDCYESSNEHEGPIVDRVYLYYKGEKLLPPLYESPAGPGTPHYVALVGNGELDPNDNTLKICTEDGINKPKPGAYYENTTKKWIPTETGTYSLQVITDEDNKDTEWNESDNEFWHTITVLP